MRDEKTQAHSNRTQWFTILMHPCMKFYNSNKVVAWSLKIASRIIRSKACISTKLMTCIKPARYIATYVAFGQHLFYSWTWVDHVTDKVASSACML